MNRSHQWLANILLGLMLTLGYNSAAQAQVPHLLNYQGYLTNPSGTPINTTLTMVFKLYDVSTGGVALYSETQSVTVTAGIYDVAIGAVTPLTLPFDVPYFLGVMVGADPEMAPRQAATASPYALHAASADGLGVGVTISGSQITGPLSSQGASADETLRSDGANWVANPLLLARQDGGVAMTGTFGSGLAPASGAGGRTMWYPGKAAFRAGYVSAAQWDDSNIGSESMGLGYNVVASGSNSTSIGGSSTASGNFASTLGWNNAATGIYSTAIGANNIASDQNSTAMGNMARSNGFGGSFVYGDANPFAFNATVVDEFAVRATGGARFVTNIDGAGNPVRTVAMKPGGILDFGSNTRQMINLWSTSYGIGVQANTTYFRSGSLFCWFVGGVHTDASCDPGGGSWVMSVSTGGLVVNSTLVSTSDRNVKTAFASVQARDILRKVVELPISSWVFKQDPNTRHIGPMAQDFAAAFRVGMDDKHIATVDADGVALAAIQGLYKMVQGKDRRIKQLESKAARVDALERELAVIKAKLGLK